ncbi:MAG: hypothetical protein U0794_13805 [Isosphaeraceae bacterium]
MARRPGLILIAVIVGSLAGGSGRADSVPERRPSILLILPDQFRAQALGCMGESDIRTPHLDRLARQESSFATPSPTRPCAVRPGPTF